MFSMIVKMSSITFVYVAVTFLLWKALADRKIGTGDRIALGFIYGILSIFSTHVGIDFGNMVLNVRDLGPMAAGYVSPASLRHFCTYSYSKEKNLRLHMPSLWAQ